MSNRARGTGSWHPSTVGAVLAALIALAPVAGCGDREPPPAPQVRTTALDDRGSAGGAPTVDPAEERWRTLVAVPWPAATVDWAAPIGTAGLGGEPAAAGYAGSAACAPCHGEEAAAWRARPMAQTGLRRIDRRRDRDLVAAFARAETVVHPSGFTYRPERRGARLLIVEELPGPDGLALHRREVEVTHRYAAGALGVAFGAARGGRVFQVPLDWYPGTSRWALDPSFGRGNPRFSRPFSAFCLSCHSDPPRHRSGSEDAVLEPLPAGIGCERCHGPGAKHVRTAEATDVVDPGRLSPRRQLQICAQCHLQGAAEVPRGAAFGFVAGDPLDDHRHNFVEEAPPIDELQLTAQAERLVRSACWTGSGGALTCTTCHDPHAAHDRADPARWRRACVGCHRETAASGPADAGAATPPASKRCTETAERRAAVGDACATCHMRRVTPDDFRRQVPGVELPIADHWIRVMRGPPAVAAATRAAGAVTTFAALIGDPAGAVPGPAERAVAEHTVGHGAVALEAMLASYQAAPPTRQVAEYFADRYRELAATRPMPAEQARAAELARRALAAAVRAAPDDPYTLVAFARAAMAAGDPAAARSALDRALTVDPDDAPALIERGQLALTAGDLEAARRDLERAAAVSFDAPVANLLLAYLDRARPAHAAEHLEAALAGWPGDPWIIDRLVEHHGAAGDADRRADAERLRDAWRRAGFPSSKAAGRWPSSP